MPLNYTFQMVNMINFMCILTHTHRIEGLNLEPSLQIQCQDSPIGPQVTAVQATGCFK